MALRPQGAVSPGSTRFAELQRRGVGRDSAAKTAGSPHGLWRLGNNPALTIAMPTAYFGPLGLSSVAVLRSAHPPSRRIRTRTSGGVGGVQPRGCPLSRLLEPGAP
jgi:hypothetical protein